jgi:hypothetical protein
MNTHSDIFGLDPILFPPWAPGRGPRPRENPYAKETVKVMEIKDRFMKTRYKVALTDFDGKAPEHDDLTREDRNFQVVVVSFNYDEPVEVVHRDFAVYEEALKFFREESGRFQALAQLDSRDAEDIRIYAERTGYRRIDPDCCRNCKWARPADRRNCMFEEWRGRLRGKFFCMNSELYSALLRDLSPDEGQHDGYHDFAEPRRHLLDITPAVDPDGICDGYERRPKDTPPSPPPRPFPPPPPGPLPPGPLPPGPPPPPPPHSYVPGPLPYGRP